MSPPVGTVNTASLANSGLLTERSWWKVPHLFLLNVILFFPLITSYANGFDGSMLNGLQAVDNWQDFFHHPTGSTLGLFGAIQNIGSLVAVPFSPIMADRLGRRYTILFGAFIMVAGVAIQTAAQNFGMFIGARFLLGFGTNFAQTASPLLISELAYPSHRPALTSLFNSLWFSGSIVAAWSTFGTFRINSTWSWRVPSLLQGVPSVLQLFFLWFVPESPRWLIAQGREAEALRILAKYHAGGNEHDPLVQFEYTEIKEALRIEREIAETSSYLDLVRTKPNLKRLRIIVAIGFFSQWSGNGLISYYLSPILRSIGVVSQFKQTLINGILQIWNFAIAITSSVLAERLGRRFMWITSTAGMLVFYALITALAATFAKSVQNDASGNPIDGTGNKSAGNAFIAMIFLYNGFYAIAYTPLLITYAVEIMPFRIRAKGLAVLNLTITAALVFNQYTNPIAFDALHWKYYLIYSIWLAFELAFMLRYAVETKGRSLEECAMLFDDKVDDLAARTHQKTDVHIDEKAADDDSLGKE